MDARCWKPVDFKREKAFVARGKLTVGADVVYVNGDSLIAIKQSVVAESPDEPFKARRLGG